MNFKNKTYIIVGGTSGLGLVSVKALLEKRANVIAIGNNKEKCLQVEKELSGNIIVLQGDAVEPQTIQNAIVTAKENFGKIHGLFHVAGGSGRRFGDGPLHKMTDEGWDKTMDLNMKSIMISNRAIINYFLDEKIAGVILNMGSVLGYSPSPKYFVTHAYSAAKSALIGFTKSIAAYYAESNIRVNVIAPSLFITPMAERAAEDDAIMGFIKTKQPLDGGRPGYPEDIVSAVLMFMDEDSKFITGQVLAVDGGWSISEGQY